MKILNEFFAEQISAIKKEFEFLTAPEDRYNYVIDLGRKAPSFPSEHKIAANLVRGCQSELFLLTHAEDGKLFFNATSEALISAGLAQLLVRIYSGATPQTILLNPPTFLQEIGLLASLSPSRSNGLASIYVRMKQEALKHLTSQGLK